MKLTTKLLLGATVVAGLSISAFAACANNVEMGGKQLKDVAEPTVATDATTKGYVDTVSLLKDTVDVDCTNSPVDLAVNRDILYVTSDNHAAAFVGKIDGQLTLTNLTGSNHQIFNMTDINQTVGSYQLGIFLKSNTELRFTCGTSMVTGAYTVKVRKLKMK